RGNRVLFYPVKISIQTDSLYSVVPLYLEIINKFLFQSFIPHGGAYFNAMLQVSCHPVGRTYIHFLIGLVTKNEDAAMFKEAINNSFHLYVFAQPGTAR